MPAETPRPVPPPLDPHAPGRRKVLELARRLIRYHRMTFEGGPAPRGPVIYVALHGAGYLVLDLVMSCYFLGWKEFHESGRLEDWRPLRIVGAESKIEKFIPGLPRVKDYAGIIGTAEEDCVAVLERGESLLVTPGGMREAQPATSAEAFYRLRWEGRYGFVRLALRTGAPIVPMAVVGGAEAYPGLRWKKLSFWSPVPLPARMRLVLGEPIPVERAPDRARDMDLVKPLHAVAWQRTQALYDRLLAERKAQ
jgi:1-acyl-sn-glycerol-3-phosphate acyltransferase